MATCPKTTKVGEWGIPEKNYQNPVQWSLQEAYIILHNGNISKKLFQLILPLIFSLTKGKKVERHFQWSTVDSKKCSDIPGGHWKRIQLGINSSVYFGHFCLTGGVCSWLPALFGWARWACLRSANRQSSSQSLVPSNIYKSLAIF